MVELGGIPNGDSGRFLDGSGNESLVGESVRMTPRYFRQVNYEYPSGEWYDLETCLKSMGYWGYPRDIEPIEREQAHWFVYVDQDYVDGIVWFIDQGDGSGRWCVHAIARPGVQEVLGTPRVMVALEIMGELLGAKRLYSPMLDTEPKAMARYLEMRGWKRDEFGSYRDLGGP